MNKVLKKLTKHLFAEKTNLHAGNLAYSTILALAPTLILTMSLLNIISTYTPLLKQPYLIKINDILATLNINHISNIIINLICINLLSSAIFSLLTTFETLYKFQFKNYIRKKLYSIGLSFIIILTIITSLSFSFTIKNIAYLSSIDYLIDLFIIFLSLITFYKFSTFQKLKNIYIGSLISSLFLTTFLHFFYYIINHFSKLKTYYGILTPLIIFLLLIYYSCYIIYLGILINYETKKLSRIKVENK